MEPQRNEKIGKGFFWKLLENFGVSGINFILQIILARILSPEHYGVLSIMIIFTNLADVFIHSGFGTSLIQNKDVTEEDYSSVFWVTLVLAAFAYGIIFVAAPGIADFYGMPDLVQPLRILALMLFPGTLTSIQCAKIFRELDFKKNFYSNMIGTVVSGVIGITVAYMGGGLWALVVQRMVNIVINCIVLHFVVHLKLSFACNFHRVRVLFTFGWKLLVSALLDTLYSNLQSLVIGKKYNSTTLAYNDKGKNYPQFIINAVNGAIQSVMLPAMSAEQDNQTRVKNMMRTSMTMSAYIIFPMMAGLAAVATPLVRLMLTDKWLPCVPYLQIYCFSQAFYPVHSCNLQAINAMGRSDLFLKLEIIKKSYGIVILAIAVFCFDSPLAIAATGVLSTLIGWFVNSFPNKSLIGYSYKEQIVDIFPILFMALGMCVMVLMVGKWCQVMGMITVCIMSIQIIVGVGLYVLMSLVTRPRPFVIMMEQLRRIVKK